MSMRQVRPPPCEQPCSVVAGVRRGVMLCCISWCSKGSSSILEFQRSVLEQLDKEGRRTRNAMWLFSKLCANITFPSESWLWFSSQSDSANSQHLASSVMTCDQVLSGPESPCHFLCDPSNEVTGSAFWLAGRCSPKPGMHVKVLFSVLN